jgi:hypothetical protein
MRNDYFALSVIYSGSMIDTLQVCLVVDYAHGLSLERKELNLTTFKFLFLNTTSAYASETRRYDYFVLALLGPRAL